MSGKQNFLTKRMQTFFLKTSSIYITQTVSPYIVGIIVQFIFLLFFLLTSVKLGPELTHFFH